MRRRSPHRGTLVRVASATAAALLVSTLAAPASVADETRRALAPAERATLVSAMKDQGYPDEVIRAASSSADLAMMIPVRVEESSRTVITSAALRRDLSPQAIGTCRGTERAHSWTATYRNVMGGALASYTSTQTFCYDGKTVTSTTTTPLGNVTRLGEAGGITFDGTLSFNEYLSTYNNRVNGRAVSVAQGGFTQRALWYVTQWAPVIEQHGRYNGSVWSNATW